MLVLAMVELIVAISDLTRLQRDAAQADQLARRVALLDQEVASLSLLVHLYKDEAQFQHGKNRELEDVLFPMLTPERRSVLFPLRR